MNTSIFYPIQLYQYESPTQRYSRVEPPSRIEPQSMEFSSHFIENIPHLPTPVAEHWKSQWTYKATLWGINAVYLSYFRRGYAFLLFLQNNKTPPFETRALNFMNTDDMNVASSEQFLWGYSLYQLPETYLFCAIFHQFPAFQITLDEIVLVTEDSETDSSNDAYNFLPFRKNKDIPFYEIQYTNHNQLFGFTYLEKPKGSFWKATSSQLCYPTEDSTAYATSFECFEHHTPMKPPFQDHYFQDPMTQITQIGEASAQVELPSSSSLSAGQVVGWTCLLLILLCGIFFVLWYMD